MQNGLWGEAKGEALLSGYRVSIWDDRKALSTNRMLLHDSECEPITPLNHTLKRRKWQALLSAREL